MAQKCVKCYVCKRARVRQKGLIFWFVKVRNYSPVPMMELYDLPNKNITYIGSTSLPKHVFESLLETR